MVDVRYPGYQDSKYPGHAALRHLRRGRVLDLEGMRFKMATDEKGEEAPVELGDTYIAARNTVDVYVAARVDEECHYVYPEGAGYPFGIHECVRVVEAKGDEGPVVFALP